MSPADTYLLRPLRAPPLAQRDPGRCLSPVGVHPFVSASVVSLGQSPSRLSCAEMFRRDHCLQSPVPGDQVSFPSVLHELPTRPVAAAAIRRKRGIND
jgi:hypothetical protein